LSTTLHPLFDRYLKLLPKFNGNFPKIFDACIIAFQDFIENLLVEHEDIFMWMFVHCLEGEG
jgi:hypothetical protein